MEIRSRLRLQNSRPNIILNSLSEIYKWLEITSFHYLKSIELSFQFILQGVADDLSNHRTFNYRYNKECCCILIIHSFEISIRPKNFVTTHFFTGIHVRIQAFLQFQTTRHSNTIIAPNIRISPIWWTYENVCVFHI